MLRPYACIMPFSGWHFHIALGCDYGDLVLWIGRIWLNVNWTNRGG